MILLPRRKIQRLHTIKTILSTAVLLSCGYAVRNAAAQGDTPKPGTITYTGLADFYLGINFRSPSPASILTTTDGQKIGIDNVGRSFDINNLVPSLSLAELNIVRTEGKGIPFGITVTLTAGDTARIVHANEPGGTSAWQTFQQVYVTKSVNILKHPITFDFGKFVTPFGYEVIESVNNDEYSRSFGFQYAIPFYHFGLRANTPLTKTLSFYGAVVNGWNDAADDNNAKSGILQLSWAPTGSLTTTLSYMGGQEGTGAYGAGIPINKGYIDTNLFEIQPTYQITPKLKVAGVLDYGQGAGTNGTAHVSGYWIGMAGYGRYQINKRFAVAARLEQFEDAAGAGGIGLRTGLPGYTRLRELTVDFEYGFFKNKLITRLEYRHDHSNQPFFLGANGATTVDQDTLTLGAVVKF